MTNYSAWDSKAAKLVEEVDEEEKKEKEASDKALGLEGGPEGPPTAKAKQELEHLGDHSKKRLEFIEWSRAREVSQSHKAEQKDQAPVEISGEDVKGKAVRIRGSEGVNYVVPPDSGALKLMFDECRNVTVRVKGSLLTSTVELYKCEDFELDLEQPLGTLQVDECPKSVRVLYAERDHLGSVYHQNSPGLEVHLGGKPRRIGERGAYQLVSRLVDGRVATKPVQRGEGEFPIDLPSLDGQAKNGDQPEPEAPPAPEERKQQAEKLRLQGNDMFRASDFAQAAALYTAALELDSEQAAVWSNRSQCWLKLGDHNKALADAIKCTEVDPANAKGWFRKGMSLHAMQRYPEAIPALLEAERIEPTNKQIQDAIKMAQMMARKAAASS